MSTTAAPGMDSDALPWVTTSAAWAVAGVCAWSSIIITCWQIYMHLKTYTRPEHQRWIVRICFMVPIYAFCSWLSLRFYYDTKITVYLDTIRGLYEAFVIYVFVSLCFEYLGGEAAILSALHGRENVPMWFTCTCCLAPFPYDLQFLRFIKQGVLQFCVVKPFMALITIACVATDNYEDGNFAPGGGYLWVAIAYNTSIGIALSALLLFYSATHDLLEPYRPVLKFFIVKAVIFFAFWQGFGLMIAQDIGMIKDRGDVKAGQIAMAYQNFIICMEMVLASVGLLYGFPHSDYKIGGPQAGSPEVPLKGVAANLKNTLNPKDVYDDTVRNFSSTYKKYARAHSGAEEDVVERATSDEDTDVEADPASQGRVKKKKLRKSKYSRMEDMEIPEDGAGGPDHGEEDHEDGDITGEAEQFSDFVAPPVAPPKEEFSDFVVPTVAPPKDFAVFKPADDESADGGAVFEPLEDDTSGGSYVEVSVPDDADDEMDVDAEAPSDSLA